MIKRLIKEIVKKLPYHYQIEADRLRICININPDPEDKDMDIMDFIESLGFVIEETNNYQIKSKGAVNLVGIAYRKTFDPERLPLEEKKFLKDYSEDNSFRKINSLTKHKIL